MDKHTTTVIPVDPLHPQRGLLFPAVAQRVLIESRHVAEDVEHERLARDLLARVVAGDTRVRLLGLARPDGEIVGHALLVYDGDTVFVFQARADGNVGTALRHVVEIAEGMARDLRARGVTLLSGRQERGWEREAGFEPIRHLMFKPRGI
jgi:hypothetical protein